MDIKDSNVNKAIGGLIGCALLYIIFQIIRHLVKG